MQELRQSAKPSKAYVAIRRGLTASLLTQFFIMTHRHFQIRHSVHDLSIDSGTSTLAVVLIDVSLDLARSHERLLRAARERTSAPAVALCKVRDRKHVDQIMASGFAGVIAEDDCTVEGLVRKLDLIAAGEAIVPEAFFRSAEPNADSPLERLSETEHQILTLVMEGCLNKEIAAQIGRSEIAVKMQVRSLCEKLNARNRTELAMIGMRIIEG